VRDKGIERDEAMPKDFVAQCGGGPFAASRACDERAAVRFALEPSGSGEAKVFLDIANDVIGKIQPDVPRGLIDLVILVIFFSWRNKQ
jgi:hypothetical protein